MDVELMLRSRTRRRLGLRPWGALPRPVLITETAVTVVGTALNSSAKLDEKH